jgi:hypothetical protein
MATNIDVKNVNGKIHFEAEEHVDNQQVLNATVDLRVQVVHAIPDLPRTPKEVFDKDSEQRRKNMAFRREDGLIIFLLKLILNYRFWHFAYQTAVYAILKVSGKLNKPTHRPELWVRHAADTYMSLMGMLLLICYWRLLDLARTADSDNRPVMWAVLWSIVPVFRLGESLSVVVMLHANGPYHSPEPMRAVSKTLWAYLEFVVIFGTVYLGIAAAAGDRFATGSDPSFLKSWVNPLYFSMITIATVGYGDFAPQTDWGRSVVAIEVFCGLVLLVVALQRVLTVSLSSQK